MFEPIAIIGRACLLPGALTPAQLWEVVLARLNCITPVTTADWRLDPKSVLATSKEKLADHVSTDHSGRIIGFESIFNPEGFLLPAAKIMQQDRLCQWLLHTARSALLDAGYLTSNKLPKTGLIVGNLSYPTDSLSRYAESVYLTNQPQEIIGAQKYADLMAQRPTADNRFMSGLPIFYTAAALGLTATSYAIDAACASALYAIKLACDQLQDGAADVMLAGGVNATDSLFLNAGFTALRALSTTGNSKPLQRDADGLVPAHGAGLVVLKRLSDAIQTGDTILGVIRGIGLSNDGNSGGFLIPAQSGQVAAMRQAYELSGTQPDDISWVECHATGTLVGDAAEVKSMQHIFQQPKLAVGALKANIGHSITTSGVAAVINVLSAFQAGLKPPTRYVSDNLAEAVLASPFQVLNQAELWEVPQDRRLAAINCFGFGGNNAHLILEQWQPKKSVPIISQPVAKTLEETIAIVGIGIITASATNKEMFTDAVFNAKSLLQTNTESGISGGYTEQVELSIVDSRFPPADLHKTLGQQLLFLKAVQLAVAEIKSWDPGRTEILAGMQCDPEITRGGLAWRLSSILPQHDTEWHRIARDNIQSTIEAANIVGNMPNIVANRVNVQFDFKGPSYSVSAEEASGLQALDIGIRDLRMHTTDMVLAGAVDICCEITQVTAAQQVLDETRQIPGDAAVVLILKRLSDAQAQGDTIYATLSEPDTNVVPGFELNLADSCVTPIVGHAHAASGLLHVATAALACYEQLLPAKVTRQPIPWVTDLHNKRTAQVNIDALGGIKNTIILQEYDSKPRCSSLAKIHKPLIKVYSGKDRSEILQALLKQQTSNIGPARLVIVGRDKAELIKQYEIAQQWLQATDNQVVPAGMYFRSQPLEGELAFVFTGATTSYPGMGCDLLLNFPQLLTKLDITGPALQKILKIWASLNIDTKIAMFDELKISSLIAQLHALLNQQIFNLKPHACIGYCSGETNSLVAMQAWRDTEQLHADIENAKFYTDSLYGDYSVLGADWPEVSNNQDKWVGWRVFADVAAIRNVIADTPYVRLTIINTANDCIIAGHPSACEQVLLKLNQPRAKQLPYNMIIHCPEFRAMSALWRQAHHRETYSVKEVRFYSAGSGKAYIPTAETAADALLLQAQDTVDFPAVVKQAWQDGVRIFVEHGPRDLCSRWIKDILHDKPHLVVSMDMLGITPFVQIAHTMAQLLAAGVSLDYTIFQEEA